MRWSAGTRPAPGSGSAGRPAPSGAASAQSRYVPAATWSWRMPSSGLDSRSVIDPIGLGVRQRPQEDSVDQAEDRRVHAGPSGRQRRRASEPVATIAGAEVDGGHRGAAHHAVGHPARLVVSDQTMTTAAVTCISMRTPTAAGVAPGNAAAAPSLSRKKSGTNEKSRTATAIRRKRRSG